MTVNGGAGGTRMPQQFLTVSEVARRMGAVPRDISDLSYARQLRDDLCPVIGGRRLIPVSYVSDRRGGRLRAVKGFARRGRQSFWGSRSASRSQQPRLAAGTEWLGGSDRCRGGQRVSCGCGFSTAPHRRRWATMRLTFFAGWDRAAHMTTITTNPAVRPGAGPLARAAR